MSWLQEDLNRVQREEAQAQQEESMDIAERRYIAYRAEQTIKRLQAAEATLERAQSSDPYGLHYHDLTQAIQATIRIRRDLERRYAHPRPLIEVLRDES